jgi:hypothetical protein
LLAKKWTSDLLVNNAGLGEFGTFHQLPVAGEARLGQHGALLFGRTGCMHDALQFEDVYGVAAITPTRARRRSGQAGREQYNAVITVNQRSVTLT